VEAPNGRERARERNWVKRPREGWHRREAQRKRRLNVIAQARLTVIHLTPVCVFA